MQPQDTGGMALPCQSDPELFFAEKPPRLSRAVLETLPGAARLPGRGAEAQRAVGCLGWRTVPARRDHCR